MNKELMKDIKKKYKTPKKWSKEMIKEHIESVQNEDIETVNTDYINILKSCNSWNDVVNIIKDWIF